MRLREPGYYERDSEGNEVYTVDPKDLDWTTVQIVPSSFCSHLLTMCRECANTWGQDWIADPEQDATEIEIILGREV